MHFRLRTEVTLLDVVGVGCKFMSTASSLLVPSVISYDFGFRDSDFEFFVARLPASLIDLPSVALALDTPLECCKFYFAKA